jgi:hypothetical protein
MVVGGWLQLDARRKPRVAVWRWRGWGSRTHSPAECMLYVRMCACRRLDCMSHGERAVTGPHLCFEGLSFESKVPSLGTFRRSPRGSRHRVRKVTEIAEDWYHARAQASRRCSVTHAEQREFRHRKGQASDPSDPCLGLSQAARDAIGSALLHLSEGAERRRRRERVRTTVKADAKRSRGMPRCVLVTRRGHLVS